MLLAAVGVLSRLKGRRKLRSSLPPTPFSGAGDWKGIYFTDYIDDAASLLEHCVVEYGGHTHSANVYVANASPTIKNSKIRHSSVNGITVAGDSKPVIGAENAGNNISHNGTCGIIVSSLSPLPIRYNTFTNNGSYPIQLRAMTGADLTGNTFIDNGIQAIERLGEEVTSDTVWRNAGVPYAVTGDITVRHSSYDYSHSYRANGRLAALTIEPGVEVRFNPGTGLYIGKYLNSSYSYWGALKAQGTAEAPIIFTSNAPVPVPGDWKGIYFTDVIDDATTLLEHCVVEYGGHTHSANVYVANASPTIKSSTIRYSSGNGVSVSGVSSPLIGGAGAGNLIGYNAGAGIFAVDISSNPTIFDNTISNNGSYAIRVGSLINSDYESNTILGNRIQAIELPGQEITADRVLKKASVPYVVTGDITVRHSSYDYSHSYRANGRLAALTIEPGVEVRFSPGTGLYIGKYLNSSYSYWGALKAQGTAEAPIIFTSNAPAPAPGDWKGIYFTSSIDHATTFLEHCVVEYGGHTHSANVYVANASPTIKNSKIRHSSVNGLTVCGGFQACDRRMRMQAISSPTMERTAYTFLISPLFR